MKSSHRKTAHVVKSAENGTVTFKKKMGTKERILIIVVLIVALVFAGIAVWRFTHPTIDDVTGGWFYDQSAEEIQEAVDHAVEDGYFNMNINTSVPVTTDGAALIGIKNIDSNKFDCIVTITLEDGTEVYKSGGLAPGSELETITLNQPLSSGEHAATALFEIYEQDGNHTKVGQTASKVTFYAQ